MGVMHAALGFCIHMLHLCICQIAHDIDIVCRQIERDPDITDTRRKWAESAGVQVKHLPQFTSHQMPLHCYDCRVEPFNMPDCELGSMDTSEFNKCKRFLNCTRQRFFDEHIDAHAKYIRCDFKMQVGGYNHCDKIGVCLFHQLTVIGITFHMKPAHCMLQVRFVRFRNTHNVNVLSIEISEDA